MSIDEMWDMERLDTLILKQISTKMDYMYVLRSYVLLKWYNISIWMSIMPKY
jgi:hypothetical protein